jgi:diguanylate cyclase
MMDLEQYRLIVEASPNMIWRSNLSTECDFFNKTWLDFTGHTMEGQLMKELAQTDDLCKTYNRQYSNELLTQLFKQAQNDNCNFSLLMMDIDDFKQINDQYGHPAGDAVLAHVARVAKNEMRNWDILGRYGGDEFIVGLYRSDLETANNIAERIRSSIESTEFLLPDLSTIKVTISVGTACFQGDPSIDALVERADKKLYDAKHNGKNVVAS